MLQQVIEKINEQVKKYATNTMIGQIGNSLICLAQQSDLNAELINQDLDKKGMDLEGCFEHIKKYAQKNKTNNFFCGTPELAQKLICEFYGIAVDCTPSTPTATISVAPPKKQGISLADLL